MQQPASAGSRHALARHGLHNLSRIHWNLPAARLYEQAILHGEARISEHGPLLATTSPHTGRSPKDKFTVREPSSESDVWWGAANQPVDEENFRRLRQRIQGYLQGREVYVFDGYAGTDPRHRLPVRIITERAWHNLFARNMFVRDPAPESMEGFEPGFVVISVPGFHANPGIDSTRSSTFIQMHLGERVVLIGGTEYAGEIKKSIFSVMNYYLPKQGVLSMHCSANYGRDRDDVALFFGLSGTGKTTLSADPARTLIGDDEHGWSDEGVFNIEGGCYAKVIRLDPEGEPEIFATTRRFGTILENVACDPASRRLDLDDETLTENTRASYPITQLSGADLEGRAGHPSNVVFLTCDAFGVLPPISRLDEAQAMYHFLCGYTAKVAGTEKGVTEPTATFSACFGAPFMPLHPSTYAEMLGERIRRHGSRVWLLNTGWTGGPYGLGSRIRLRYTRRMVAAALSGELEGVETVADPIFGVHIPQRVEGVPPELLQPRRTWPDEAAYEAAARRLAQMFHDNFRAFAEGTSEEIRAAAPRLG